MLTPMEEIQRELNVKGRTFILKKDPVYSMWTVWNKANNYMWEGQYTTYDKAVLGAKQLYNDQEKPIRVKKVHLTPKEDKQKEE